MLRLALQSQIGVDAANAHYTLAGSSAAAAPTLASASSSAATTSAPAPNRIADLQGAEVGGMYL